MRGRHVLITGGSMGIGRAVAGALARRGARLTLVARGTHALQAAASELEGDGHETYALDVGDERAWPALASRLGELHGLVCAAGVLGPIGPPGAYEPADFRLTIETNLLGTLLAVHHCLQALRSSRGAVVTFSGGGATSPLPRYDAYAASKAAVVRLTENMARELRGQGVRLNAVAPGFVATRMHRATLGAGPELAGAEYHERTRLELDAGGAPAEDAAELVCLLLGPEEEAPFAGKLISAQWDPWRDRDFRARLARDSDLATLRRIDGTLFSNVRQDERP